MRNRINNLEERAHSDSENSTTVRRRLFSSFSVQVSSIILRVIQQIVIVPILIYAWGTNVYQDWIILFSASSLFTIVDFGVQAHFGNALLIAWSKNDEGKYKKIFTLSIFIYLFILFITFLLLFGTMIISSWPSIIGTRFLDEKSSLSAFLLLTISTLILVPTGVFTGIYRSRGNYVHGTLFYVVADACRGFGVCLSALFGATPAMAAWIFSLIALLYWAVIIIDLRHRYGPLPFSSKLPSRGELREAISGSAQYFIPSAVTNISINIPIILLGKMDNVSGAIVTFSVVRTFTGFVRQMVLQICVPIGFEMSRQSALDEHEKLKKIFFGGGRLASGLSGILSGISFIVAELFISVWTHNAITYNFWIVVVFTLTIVFISPAQIPFVFFQTNNRPKILAISQALYCLFSVLFCVLAIPFLSATGAAIGMGLAECLSLGVLLPYAASRLVAVSVGSYFVHSYVISAYGFLVSSAVAWVVNYAIKAHNLFGLCCVGAAWFALMIVPSYYILLSTDERSRMSRAIAQKLAKLGILRREE